MTPLAAVAVKTVGAAGSAALLSLGLAGTLAQAAPPSPKPTPAAAAQNKVHDPMSDRRVIARAVFQSEADVLGMPAKTLRGDLRNGQKVSDLAKDKGLTKDQFATHLTATLRPRLEDLVGKKAITQAEADRAFDRIAKGFVPFWNGIHPRK